MNCPIYQSKCPKCNQSTKMNIEQELIHINCQCGYHNAIMISDYISNTPHSAIKDDSFKDIINELKKGNDHILAYFNTLKNEHITHLMRLAKEIEAMYEDSYKRNKNALTCLQTLIDNYDGTIDMKNKILDNSVNIYQCRDSSNSDAVIKYYKNYKNIKTINIKETKTLTEHSDAVYSLLLLNDGRVASCSDDNTIRIYDPSNDYHCDTVIKRHSNRISSICQVDDGTIVSCSRDGTIIIGDYTIYDIPKASINKVITMTNNRIASCSEDRTIKIWKSIKPYSNTPIKVLEGLTDYVQSILYIKERDMMISGSWDTKIHLWNMSTYQCIAVINEIECCEPYSLYQIDKDRVIIGGLHTFSIVNIDKFVIEKKIDNESFDFVNCFAKLRDNKTILCGCCDRLFCFYDMNTEECECKITTKKQYGDIYALLLMDDKTFLSGSRNGETKVWGY